MKRVALYIRVSTSKQDTENQRRELEAVADRSGWKIVKVYEDAGISGAKGRDQRPGLDAMMKAVNAKEFDMVATWSVDRLGRSLTTCSVFSRAFMKRGSACSFTSKDSILRRPPASRCFRCWVHLLSLSGDYSREVNAGLARARAKGTKLGRRRVEPAIEARILELRASGDGILKIGRKLGIGTSLVQRVFK